MAFRSTTLTRYWSYLSSAVHKLVLRGEQPYVVKEIELFAGNEFFTCCRDVGHPEICENCGYTSCVEVSQALAGKPSAVVELLKCSGPD